MEFLINVGILFVIGWVFGNDRKDRGLVGIRTITLVLFGSFMFTHIASTVAGDSTRIIGLSKGEIVFDGTPAELTDEAIERIYNTSRENLMMGVGAHVKE